MKMDRTRNPALARAERRIYALISQRDGIRAREIAGELEMDRAEVNRELYASPLMRELCYQDGDYRWHALIPQRIPHEGLYKVSGYYGLAREFLALGEEEWLEALKEGCGRIGRSLSDTRGLIHSFRDCREVIRNLFGDLDSMTGGGFGDWELVFEMRLNRGRMIRIYADVLIITRQRVFSLEFKMKNKIDPEEVLQAAKYTPYLEILFGPRYDVIPALVLTGARDLFEYVPIPGTEAVLPVCSGDMLFNVLDEYMGFLQK